MTLSPELIASYFQFPEADVFGIRVSMDFGGEPPSIGELSACIGRLQECQKYLTSLVWVLRWSEDEESVPEALRPAIAMMIDADLRGNQLLANSALRQLSISLGLCNAIAAEDRFYPRFEFVGACRRGPIFLRFDLKGTSHALIAAILVFRAVQLMKELGFEACRTQAGDIAKSQRDQLEKSARRLGRWNPDLLRSHKVVVAAAAAVTARCGSLLSGFGLHVHVPRGPDFDVRLDATPSAPQL